LASSSVEQRRGLIDAAHPKLTVSRQCELLGLPRSSFYHRPQPAKRQDLELMRVIDETYLAYPFFGSRQMTRWLRRQGHEINRKRVQRLMRLMGLEAIYQKPNLSRANAAHKIYPYLLRNLLVQRPDQVWATDITYVPIQGGYIYLCAVIDWFSRRVLTWEISNTLDAGFCIRAVARAIAQYGVPEIFNTDQGCQFTAAEFTRPLLSLGVKLSMDGKGRALDNVFVERLWRSVKYEEIYLKCYVSTVDAHAHLDRYFHFYNHRRPHSSLNDSTPDETYRDNSLIAVIA
jgi:putative transposase